MFNELQIKNFKGIKKLEMKKLARINLLVGENNCGKTSVLEALFLSMGAHNPETIARIHRFRELTMSKAEDMSFIFHNFDYKKHPHVKLQGWGKTLTADFSPRDNPSQRKQQTIDATKVMETSTTVATPSVTGIEIKGVIGKGKSAKEEDKEILCIESSLEYQEGELKLSLLRSIPPDTSAWQYHALYYVVAPHKYDESVIRGLEKILDHKEQRKLIRALKVIEPAIRGIRTDSDGVIKVDIAKDIPWHPINLLGGGVSALLSILTAFPAVENNILLLDEVDTGFHYLILPKVWELVLESAKKYGVQVFATTHSEDCVEAFDKLSAPEDKVLFRIDREEGKHDAVRYSAEQIKKAIKDGRELRG